MAVSVLQLTTVTLDLKTTSWIFLSVHRMLQVYNSSGQSYKQVVETTAAHLLAIGRIARLRVTRVVDVSNIGIPQLHGLLEPI